MLLTASAIAHPLSVKFPAVHVLCRLFCYLVIVQSVASAVHVHTRDKTADYTIPKVSYVLKFYLILYIIIINAYTSLG